MNEACVSYVVALVGEGRNVSSALQHYLTMIVGSFCLQCFSLFFSTFMYHLEIIVSFTSYQSHPRAPTERCKIAEISVRNIIISLATRIFGSQKDRADDI